MDIYKRITVSLFITFSVGTGYAQSVLLPEKISKLIPDRIKGYYEEGDAKSSLITLGTIRYSLVERRFSRGKEHIKILLFDYKEASIMYKQAMRKWNHEVVVTDSLVLRNIEMDNCNGWESYNRQSYSSQIFLGICDRFFLMISAENVPLDRLRDVLNSFSFQDFPN
jgi:hypothetical protein